MDSQKNDKPIELTAEDLDRAVGGSRMLTQPLPMRHEGSKSIIQNFRA